MDPGFTIGHLNLGERSESLSQSLSLLSACRPGRLVSQLLSKLLLSEENSSSLGLVLAAGETEAPIEGQGDAIVLLHLKSKLAAIEQSRLGFHRFEQAPTDALVPELRGDVEIVDVDDAACGEGRESDEACGHADGPILVEREEDESGRVFAQAVDQRLLDGFRKIAPVAHRISSVVTRHLKHYCLMLRLGEISLDDAELVHVLTE